MTNQINHYIKYLSEECYQEDYNLALRTVDILLQDASSNKDEAFLKKLQNTFAPFQVKPTDGSNLTQPLQQ